MSNSPWVSDWIYEVITKQLKENKKLKIGASQQYIGSLGKS